MTDARYITLSTILLTITLAIHSPTLTQKALACDIHNFLVIPNQAERTAAIRSIFRDITTALLPDFFKSFFFNQNRNPRAALYAALNLIVQGDISGEGFYTIFKQNGYDALANTILVASNAYEAPQGMAQLLQELKNNNVMLLVASNIGTQFYEKLKNKNPALQKLFSPFNTTNPGVTVEFVTDEGSVVSHPIKKPEQEFFQQVISYAQERGISLENTYFGDDNLKYTQAAETAGIHGIHFNAQQHGGNAATALRKKLIEHSLISETKVAIPVATN